MHRACGLEKGKTGGGFGHKRRKKRGREPELDTLHGLKGKVRKIKNLGTERDLKQASEKEKLRGR